MARRNYLQELEYQNAKGMDTTSSIPNIMPGFVRQALNTNITDQGTYQKRNGFRPNLASDPWSGNNFNIRSGLQFFPKNQASQLLIYGSSGAAGELGKVSFTTQTNNLVFTEDFGTDAGFTYNNLLAEFVSGKVQQKLQAAPFLLDFSAGLDATTTGGVATPVATNPAAVSVVAGKVQMDLSSGNTLTYDLENSLTSVNGLVLNFKWTPGYTTSAGSPAPNFTTLFHVTNTTPNLVNCNYNWQAGSFDFGVSVPAGNQFAFATISSGHFVTAGVEYDIRIVVDIPNQTSEFWFNGSLIASPALTGGAGNLFGTWNATSDFVLFNQNYSGNDTFDDVEIRDLGTSYDSSLVTLPSFVASTEIVAMTAFSTTSGGTERFIVDGKYWDGAAWVTSNSTFAQANSAADVNTNIATLSTINCCVVPVSAIFQGGDVQGFVDEVTLDYDTEETVGTVATIKSGITSDRAFMVTANQLVHTYSGDVPFLYDGVNERQIGIDQPTAIPTGVAGVGGALNASSTYSFAYSYRNSGTKAESTPRISDPVVLAAGQNQVTLTILPGDAALADEIVIYRSVANGNLLFQESTIAIGSTTHVSILADTLLSNVALELDNSRLSLFSTTPNFPIVANNRVFVKTANNEIRFSKIGQSGAMPESFEATAFVTTEGSHGGQDDVVGIGKINDLPIVIKDRSVGRLDEAGVPDVGVSTDLVRYIYREISNVVGGVAHAAGCQVFSEYLFLGRDGIYATNGMQVRSIAESIRKTLLDLSYDPTFVQRLSAVNDTENKRVYFSAMESSSESDPNLVLVGDYQNYPEFRWTIYSPAPFGLSLGSAITHDSSTHPGIQAGCFFTTTDDSTGEVELFFGSVRNNAQIYKMGVGESDQVEPGADGLGIYFNIETRAYTFNEPLIEKLFKDTEFFAVAKDKTYSMQVGSIYDLSGRITNNRAFELPTFGSIWADSAAPTADDGLWADNTDPQDDDALWAGDTLTRLNYDPHHKGRFYQVIYQQIEASAPITLYGWGVQASFMRPR